MPEDNKTKTTEDIYEDTKNDLQDRLDQWTESAGLDRMKLIDPARVLEMLQEKPTENTEEKNESDQDS